MQKRTFLTYSFVIAALCGAAQTDPSRTEPDTLQVQNIPVELEPDTLTSEAAPAEKKEYAGEEEDYEEEIRPAHAPRKKGEAAHAKLLQRANSLYSQRAFAEAIPLYEKARFGDSGDMVILMKLGDCYRHTNNVNGELHCYGEIVRSGSALPEHYLYYAQALHELGETEKAKTFFDQYTADARGQALALSAAREAAYRKNADAYSVTPVAFNSMQNDYCAVYFYDAVVFTSARARTQWIKRRHGWTGGAFMKIYATQRGGDGYNPPQLFMGDLKSKFNDGPLCFSKDYNTVYFTRNNSGKAERAKDGTFKLKILEAQLDQNGFSMVNLMPFHNKEFNFTHPSVSADGQELYFASDMEGGMGGMDIYVSRKDGNGVWGTPENMGELVNTKGNEVFPFIAQNGILYFSSDGHDGMGGLDIYEVKRRDGKVKRIYNMGEPVNSRNDDFGIYLGEDHRRGFISSNRKSGGMDDDVYQLDILRDVKRGKEVTLLAKDSETGEPMDSVKLVLNSDTVYTNEKGEYVLSMEDESEYRLEAYKTDYFKSEDVLSPLMSEDEEFTREIVMEKDPKLFLRALITDARTGSLLDGVTIRLTDLATNAEVDLYTTTASGDYFKFLFGSRMGDKLAYLVRLEKPGYLPRTVVFTHEVDKPGEINMNDHVNLSLGKVEVGMDLAKMIDIKPIYFDMGKSTIRTDAALELDKIVQVMNEYPNMIIELGSHTDCRSSAASNMKLSAARAKASANYIIKKGINKKRITSRGYGESKLLNNCICEGQVKSACPEEEHARNRRTEFIITRLK